MNSLALVEDVQELDYALAMQDQAELDAAWATIEKAMRDAGDEGWTIAYEKHQIYRQREIAGKWNGLMQLARTQEIVVPVPEWMKEDYD